MAATAHEIRFKRKTPRKTKQIAIKTDEICLEVENMIYDNKNKGVK
jgi:DNA-binding GntR family transcriptional regulator